MSQPRPHTQTELSHGNNDYVHSIGWVEYLLGDVLRLKIPRALCGISLEGDPDRPNPGFDAPRCPACVARGR